MMNSNRSMKLFRATFVVAFVMLSSVGIAGAASHPGAPKWSKAQQDVWDTVLELKDSYAINPDLERCLGFFHEDFQGWYNSDPVANNKASIRPWLKNILESRKTEHYAASPVSITVLENTAIVYELHTWIYRDLDGPVSVERGYFHSVWKKEDGRWLLYSESGSMTSD